MPNWYHLLPKSWAARQYAWERHRAMVRAVLDCHLTQTDVAKMHGVSRSIVWAHVEKERIRRQDRAPIKAPVLKFFDETAAVAELAYKLKRFEIRESYRVAKCEDKCDRSRANRPWRPMTTAPKEGLILLYKPYQPHSKAIIFAGYWLRGGWMPAAGSHVITGVTAWMPLPNPPAGYGVEG